MKCKRCPNEIDQEADRTGSGFCRECFLVVYKTRATRSAQKYNARDRINEIYAEMRSAIAERDRYRREAESTKKKIRQEAVQAMVGSGSYI